MSEHTEQTTAEKIGPEPESGTVLVVDNGDEWRVIWRDDAEAQRWGGHEDEHWFSDPHSDPMALHQYVKYARAVYPLGGPIAVFDRPLMHVRQTNPEKE